MVTKSNFSGPWASLPWCQNRWCLGIQLDQSPLQAVLLRRNFRQWQVIGSWQWPTGQQAKSTKVASVTPLIWAQFVHYLFQKLQVFGTFKHLAINLGIPHKACAWSPMPKGGFVEWQRFAASHWQMPAEQVLMDILPIAKQFGLIGSIPSQFIKDYVSGLDILQRLSAQPIQIGVDTSLSSIYKIWPWYHRCNLAIHTDDTEQPFLFVDMEGVHSCSVEYLPMGIENILCCSQSSQLSQLTKTDIKMWHWQVNKLTSKFLYPWHLAYMPNTPYWASGMRDKPQALKGWYVGKPSSKHLPSC